MPINPIESNQIFLPQNNKNLSQSEKEQSIKFTDTLKDFISDVNQLQKESHSLTEKFIKGEPVDLHNVMISIEKAKTSFQLLMEMRNRFLDMYQELNRMQI